MNEAPPESSPSAPQSASPKPVPPAWKTLNRLRLLAMWPVALWVVVSADQPLLGLTQTWWQLVIRLFGVLLVLKGSGLRLWAMGILLKHQQLATGGPYAYTRNPLYLGTLAIWVGLMLASNWFAGLILAVPFTLFYFFIYNRQIDKEERKLVKVFGDPYQEYLRAVPRFWPRLRLARNLNGVSAPFGFRRMLKNRGPELVFAMLLAFAAMDLSAGVLWPVVRGTSSFTEAMAVHYGQLRMLIGAP